MRPKFLRTSDLAKAVGIHPNTVRQYESWGFLPTVERSPKGYRRFTRSHLDQLRLARVVMHGSFPGPSIRKAGLELVRKSATGDLGGALEMAHRMIAMVRAERAQAEAAASFLERWAGGALAEATGKTLRIGEVARLLNTTIDSLRNWERNGLIEVPRDAHNSYRLYGAHEIGRLRVIRMLIRSGYSMMAILRMLLQLDQGQTENLREVLDTPRPDEDVLSANDRWLSTITEAEQRANQAVSLLEEMIHKQSENIG